MRKSFIAIALLSLLCLTPGGAGAAERPAELPAEKITADAGEEDKLLLSPGTVTVIKPQEMKGEQKNLPELLKQVPGLHIVETKGRGAYTTASVRGSSASLMRGACCPACRSSRPGFSREVMGAAGGR